MQIQSMSKPTHQQSRIARLQNDRSRQPTVEVSEPEETPISAQQSPQSNATEVPLLNVPTPHQNTIQTPQPSHAKISAEDIGYFNPEIEGSGDPVQSGKYFTYKYVYTFVDRLRMFAHSAPIPTRIVAACLRGSALQWYSSELSLDAQFLLLDSSLDKWYATLIKRFRTLPSLALDEIDSQSYSLRDIKTMTPRTWITRMLHLCKSANYVGTEQQLLKIHSRLHPNLQRDILEPDETTTLDQFLTQIDKKTPIWHRIAANNAANKVQKAQYPPPSTSKRFESHQDQRERESKEGRYTNNASGRKPWDRPPVGAYMAAPEDDDDPDDGWEYNRDGPQTNPYLN